MAGIRIEQTIPAPVQRVWDDIADVSSHVEWMADAESISFLTEQHEGANTRIEVLTKVGPLSTTDVMEFTVWEPPHTMGVRHVGLVTGEGAFTLQAVGDQTRFVWAEELTFPWYLGGPITAAVAAPVLKAIWRKNLARLAERF